MLKAVNLADLIKLIDGFSFVNKPLQKLDFGDSFTNISKQKRNGSIRIIFDCNRALESLLINRNV